MPKPDFFIVGAPKCGTTSLTHYLRRHPDVFIPPGKEFHHFGSDLTTTAPLEAHVRDREQYLKLFRGAAEETRVGEASVWYLYSRRAAREINEFNPEARAIVMLRNPVDMMHSLHRELLFTGDESIEDFERALAAEPDRREGRRIPEGNYFPQSLRYREAARYSEQLERYLETLGRDRVHVIFFERFRDETADVYRRTLRFLDVDPDFKPRFDRHNPESEPRSRWLRDVLRHPPTPIRVTIEGLDHLFPNLLHRWLRPLFRRLNSRPSERPPMDPDLRERLRAEFEPERRRLRDLLDRELPDW